MLNLSFYPNNQKKDKSGMVPVYMSITFNSQRIRKAVRHVKIKPSHWNEEKEIVRKPNKSEDYNGYEEFNTRLETIRESIAKINKHTLKYGTTLDSGFILKGIENPHLFDLEHSSFFTCFEEFIEIGKSHKAKTTTRNIRTILNFLLEFEKSESYKIKFANIDQRFFETLRAYTYNLGKKTGYFSKIISVLKTFMNWSFDREYHNNQAFKKFKAPSVEKEVIYLTWPELKKLYEYPFESRRLQHVRDIYCFSCGTGLRFSDVIALSQSQIYENYILKRIQKTSEVNSKIPITSFTQKILDKYSNTVHEPLPKISGQKFNDYIKECCQIAGINSPLTVYDDIGGKRIEVTKEKWELITSHTARKTFVTNSLIFGMHETVVKEITGHKKDESFRRYVKVADSYRNSEMNKAWGDL